MKHLKLSTLLACLAITTAYSEEFKPDEITFESLAQNLATDHVFVFRELFALEPHMQILEIGSNKSSKYLAENSISLNTYEIGLRDRFNDIMMPFIEINSKLNPPYPFWHLEMRVLKESVNQANNIALQGKNPLLTDTQYLTEIRKFFDDVCLGKKFDIIFIDPRIHLRADFVNEAFNRSDIIIAHDTNFNGAVYGWDRIKAPLNYTKIHFNYGSGTSLWIKNDKQQLIQQLKTKLQNKEEELKALQATPAPFLPQINTQPMEQLPSNDDIEQLQKSLWEQLSDTNEPGS